MLLVILVLGAWLKYPAWKLCKVVMDGLITHKKSWNILEMCLFKCTGHMFSVLLGIDDEGMVCITEVNPDFC